MATSLLALIDDITTVLDDVALLTKVAAKKSVGVLGDDLALNAQQVVGVSADRELPVVLAVARGSLLNKAILVPAALGISAFAPWAVTPLLMAGGLFLCYEGVEKLAHRHQGGGEADAAARLAAAGADPVAYEKDKVRGAVRTDFVLSAEIVAITLGTVAASPLGTQFAVLAGIALLMTVGVYGIVAGIVKLDDLGLYWSRRPGADSVGRGLRATGRGILVAAPYLMKALSVAGTVAMFLVGGGIISHGVPVLHHAIESLAGGAGGVGAALLPTLLDGLVGVVCGAVALLLVTVARRAFGRGAHG